MKHRFLDEDSVHPSTSERADNWNLPRVDGSITLRLNVILVMQQPASN